MTYLFGDVYTRFWNFKLSFVLRIRGSWILVDRERLSVMVYWDGLESG